MDPAMNAAYEKNRMPEERKREPIGITILGYDIPGDKVWMVTAGLFGVLVVLTVFIVFALPSGLPYLAAKNADGFLGYVGYFFGYMIGFFLILIVLFALLTALGIWSRRQIPLLR